MKRSLIVAAAAAACGVLATASASRAQDRSVSDSGDASSVDASSPSPLEALGRVASGVVEEVAPSVVLLEVERPQYGPRQLTRRERAALGVNGPYDPRYFTRPEGPCAAVVLAPDLVATSSWNLAGDGAITVVTPDGRRLHGERLGRDENLDVGLVRVEGGELTPLPRVEGDPEVGRFLFLIGRSRDNRPVVTRGIVSGLGRHRGDSFAHSARTSYPTVGGALVDLEGRLIGVSVRHDNMARQGQNSGVGFGAAAPRIEESLPKLASGEVIPRRPTPFLGIQADIRAADGPGVRISAVIDGTAAAEAGLEAGDWIKIFNQVEVESFGHLREEILSLEIGTEIVITIVRDDEEQDIKVELGSREDAR